MTTRTITVDSLIDDYAETIADDAGLDVSDYDRTAAGFASLIRDVIDGWPTRDQVCERLDDAAVNLTALTRLGRNENWERALLKLVDQSLYEAATDLA